MNWWLIVLAVIASIIILGLAFYMVILYQSEEDNNSAWWPKIVVIFGLSLACFMVLLLPFDIANKKDPTAFKDTGGGLDTVLMWQIVLWTVAVMCLAILPFTTFYYEAMDPDHYSCLQQATPAFIYTFILLIMFTVLLVVLWITVGVAEIPYQSYKGAAQWHDVESEAIVYLENKTREIFELKVSIFVYVVGLMTALGWVLFFVYGGVGLSALPIDLIAGWMNRPKPISLAEFTRERESVAAKALTLQGIGKEMENKQRKKNNNSIRMKVNMFKNEVYELERKLNRLEIAYEKQGGSIFLVYGRLFIGVCGIALSTLWIMHIFVYNTLSLSLFLNKMFLDLDKTFSLFGVLMYAIFAFYLLWCTIRGCIKVGMRIVFFQVHPMRVHDTLMNALLFNTGLILLSSVVVTQFCASSFREYAANTAVDSMMNLYVRRLKGIGWVMRYFQFFFVVMAILSVFWVMLCPNKKRKPKKEEEDDD